MKLTEAKLRQIIREEIAGYDTSDVIDLIGSAANKVRQAKDLMKNADPKVQQIVKAAYTAVRNSYAQLQDYEQSGNKEEDKASIGN